MEILKSQQDILTAEREGRKYLGILIQGISWVRGGKTREESRGKEAK